MTSTQKLQWEQLQIYLQGGGTLERYIAEHFSGNNSQWREHLQVRVSLPGEESWVGVADSAAENVNIFSLGVRKHWNPAYPTSDVRPEPIEIPITHITVVGWIG